MQSYSKRLDHDITCIDTGYARAGLAACYLVIDQGRAALIDTGVEHTIPRLQAVLADNGLVTADVDYIVPTHVHLDHAGAAGKLMQLCSNARMIIHPYGSRHMIDPSRLIAGAEAVYGKEELRRTVGEILPVDKERVQEAEDNFRFSIGGRELIIVDTPGHARHHFCIWDERSRGFFSGDTFGVAYPELVCRDRIFIFPPTTPVQFDPAAWHASIDRLMAWRPEQMYLTHFGQLDEPARYMNTLHRMIDDLAALAGDHEDSLSDLPAAVEQYIKNEMVLAGCDIDEVRFRQLLEMDLDIIVQGLGVWLTRRQ